MNETAMADEILDNERDVPVFQRCPAALNIYSVLIEPETAPRANLIRLSRDTHHALYDRIFEPRNYACNIYALLKFSEFYLDGDLTLGDVAQIAKDLKHDPIYILGKFWTHPIIQEKYQRHNSDDRLKENYVDLLNQVYDVFEKVFEPTH